MPEKPQKEPKVRKGQKTPFRKATLVQQQQRIDDLVAYLRKHPVATTAELKNFAKKRFNLQWQMALIYIARAKDHIRKESRMTKERGREIIIPKLVHLIEHGKDMIVCKASAQLADILGIKEPTKFAIGGDATAPPIKTADETPLDRLQADPPKAVLRLLLDMAAKALPTEPKPEGNGHSEPQPKGNT